MVFNKIRQSYILQAEKYKDYNWPSIPASSYLDFIRTGSREVMQAPYRERRNALNALVFGELAEGKGRFIDQIINGVWAYCEMTYCGLSAHLTMQREKAGLPDVEEPIIDLGAGTLGVITMY